jgi:hypothetical protein
MKRRKANHERSGLLNRREPEPRETIPASQPERIEAAFRAWGESASLANLLAEARENVNQIEAAALAVYRRNGLPDRDGAYLRNPADGTWHPQRIAERPGGKWIKVDDDGVNRERWGRTRIENIGEKYSANSEIGFASKILKSVSTSRALLNEIELKEDYFGIRAFNAGYSIMWNYWLIDIEFNLSDLIAPEMLAKAGRKAGGTARATAQRNKNKADWSRWKSEADRLCAQNPALGTKGHGERLGDLIVKNLNLSVKSNTVIKRIKKDGRS